MGDIKRIRRKYDVPAHPWEADRIQEEKRVQDEYALKNKKELWKAQKMLKDFRSQAGNLLTERSKRAEKMKGELLEKLVRLKFLEEGSSLDGVLLLTVDDVLNRRLQTLVYRKGLANNIRQARQFIVHGHIAIAGRKVTSPSYIVGREEEDKIGYVEGTGVRDIVRVPEEAEEEAA